MRRKKHRKPMMDQRRMWTTEGIVLESVKIGQYISVTGVLNPNNQYNIY